MAGQQSLDGSPHSMANILGGRIIIESASAAVVDDDEFAIGVVCKKMPGQAFKSGSQVDAQFVNSFEMLQTS